MRASHLDIKHAENGHSLKQQLKDAQTKERLQTAKLERLLKRFKSLQQNFQHEAKKVESLLEDLYHERELNQAMDTEIQMMHLRLAELEETDALLRSQLQAHTLRENQLKREILNLEERVAADRDRSRKIAKVLEDNRRLERCLTQAVRSRERAHLEAEYLKAELFDQRQKLLRNHLSKDS